MEILLGILVVAGVAVFGYYAWKKEKERQEKFRAWASNHNWRYVKERSKAAAQEYSFLDRLRQGHSRYAFNVLDGEWKGREAKAFTYHYATTSSNGKTTTTQHHHFGVVLIRIEKEFPELCLHPESLLHKLGHVLGRSEVDFESIEFSKKFEVRCKDKKLAFDFCNTGMMEYLLQHPDTAIEMEGNVLAVYDSHRLEPHEVEPYLEHLGKIRNLMPNYLFRA